MLLTETYKPLSEVKTFVLRDLIPSKGSPTTIPAPPARAQLAALLDNLPGLTWEQVIKNHFADVKVKPKRADYDELTQEAKGARP